MVNSKDIWLKWEKKCVQKYKKKKSSQTSLKYKTLLNARIEWEEFFRHKNLVIYLQFNCFFDCKGLDVESRAPDPESDAEANTELTHAYSGGNGCAHNTT